MRRSFRMIARVTTGLVAGSVVTLVTAYAAIIICASIEPPSAVTEALGPVAYLLKPFRLGELESALADALRVSSF